MQRNEVCVCGHPTSLHRSYGLHRHTTESSPRKERRSLAPVKNVPGTKSCSRLVVTLGASAMTD
jgi:hypothetical protein